MQEPTLHEMNEKIHQLEQQQAALAATQKAHGREIGGVQDWLKDIDQNKLTPMREQVNDIHRCMSRDGGYEEGRAAAQNNHRKWLIALSGLVTAAFTAMAASWTWLKDMIRLLSGGDG